MTKFLNRFLGAISLLIVAGLSACLAAPGSSANPTPATYTDPFAYCAAVGTMDAPDTRYTGPEVPDAVVEGLKEALDMSADMPGDVLLNGTFWRCMEGKVYGCFVGANLPCQAKADPSRTPTQAEKEFCQQNPDSEFIPAVVTGRETVYEWRCNKGESEVGRELTQPDAAGFLANIWYEINPN